MSLSLLKTGAIAAALIVALATGANAKQVLHGEMDDDSPLYSQHSQWSNEIGYADEGDEVVVYGYYKGKGGWFLIKDLDTGDHGWVRKHDVDLDWKGPKGPGPGFCFGGPYGSFCVNP
jgi:outer membrane protein assembly factor BamB